MTDAPSGSSRKILFGDKEINVKIFCSKDRKDVSFVSRRKNKRTLLSKIYIRRRKALRAGDLTERQLIEFEGWIKDHSGITIKRTRAEGFTEFRKPKPRKVRWHRQPKKK